MTVRALPEDVVRLMAAGETIDSPAAAVRELIDNAIDAGATRLALSLDLDRAFLRLADNGSGMEPADLRSAALPHSTSKIRDRADLHQIRSLGFRGEALHSLAQLSQLMIAARPAADPSANGWQMRYTPLGEVIQAETLAMAPGTIVTITDLFGSWPARRESLPPIAQQYRAVQAVVQRVAIAHPGVAWQIEREERPWLTLAPGRSVADILPQWLPRLRTGDLQSIERAVPLPPTSESGPITGTITATVGLPDRAHRRRPDWVRVVVNGRSVLLPELEQAIVAAFDRSLPRHRHPIAIVSLTVPPACLDWNRTPDKSEIYLQPLEFWQAQVQATVQAAIAQRPTQEPAYQLRRAGQLVRAAEATGSYSVARRGADLSAVGSSDPESPNPDPQNSSPPPGLALPIALKAVAQVNNTYIVAEHPGGLWLVEQHIAHERVLYEELCDRWQIVELPTPIVLEGLRERDREQLSRLGLEWAEFGEDLWAIRHAPEPLASRADCAAALRELASGADLEAAQVATACRTAIRNGTPLSLGQMQDLLDRWARSRNPRTCPHGRPIYLSLEESSLARFFRRHWVIGKSHGI